MRPRARERAGRSRALAGATAGLLTLAALWAAAVPAAAHEEPPPAAAVADPAGPATGNGFEGRVVVRGQVTPGCAVHAYRTFEDLLTYQPFASSGPTADDGSYTFDVPPGKYFLVAKHRAAGTDDGPLAVGDGFAYNGSNPITVDPGRYVHVGFGLQEKVAEVEYRDGPDPGTGAIEGVVEYEGRPLAGAMVRLFLDAEELFRGQGYSTAPPTGTSGAFRVDLLPESGFFLIVRKRARPGDGPIAEGDYFGFFVDNPVQVRAGKVARVRVEVMSKASEIGKDDSLFRATGTQIVGRILDTKGQVVPGVYAFAYEDKVMAHKRPAFISREVDKEGRYVINLSRGGVYYIGARSAYGDSPGMGEWYGRYDVSADHSVRVETGKRVEGIDVVVEKILP